MTELPEVKINDKYVPGLFEIKMNGAPYPDFELRRGHGSVGIINKLEFKTGSGPHPTLTYELTKNYKIVIESGRGVITIDEACCVTHEYGEHPTKLPIKSPAQEYNRYEFSFRNLRYRRPDGSTDIFIQP